MEPAILLTFALERARGNSYDLDAITLPMSPGDSLPAIGLGVVALNSAKDQGGRVLYSDFQLTAVVISPEGTDDVADLVAPAAELAQNLAIHSGQPGAQLLGGIILYCVQAAPACYKMKNEKGQPVWHYGALWDVRIQPDTA